MSRTDNLEARANGWLVIFDVGGTLDKLSSPVIKTLLDELRHDGYHVVIATGGCENPVKELLDSAFVAGAARPKIYAEYPKNIQGLWRLAASEKFLSSQCILVDDSEYEIRNAERCGMETLLFKPESTDPDRPAEKLLNVIRRRTGFWRKALD